MLMIGVGLDISEIIEVLQRKSAIKVDVVVSKMTKEKTEN